MRLAAFRLAVSATVVEVVAAAVGIGASLVAWAIAVVVARGVRLRADLVIARCVDVLVPVVADEIRFCRKVFVRTSERGFVIRLMQPVSRTAAQGRASSHSALRQVSSLRQRPPTARLGCPKAFSSRATYLRTQRFRLE